MSTYIRFQTSVVCPHKKRPLGIFRATGLLPDDGQVEEYFRETVDEILDWFNSNLTFPRIVEKDSNGVFWFCANRQQCIARLWGLVAILLEHQIEVRQIRTSDPGMIVYRDEFQVAAIPNPRTIYTLRV